MLSRWVRAHAVSGRVEDAPSPPSRAACPNASPRSAVPLTGAGSARRLAIAVAAAVVLAITAAPLPAAAQSPGAAPLPSAQQPGTTLPAEQQPGGAAASQPAAAPSPTLDSLIEAARASGATILIDGRPADAAGPARASMPAPSEAMESAASARLAITGTLALLPSLPGRVAQAVATAVPGSDGGWLWLALGLTVLAVAGGSLGAWLTGRWARRTLDRLEATPGLPAPKTSYVLLRTVLELARDLAFLLSGAGLVIALVPTPGPVRATALVVVLMIAAYRAVLDILTALILPHRPQERLLALDDAQARAMARRLKIIGVVGFALMGLALWARMVRVDAETLSALRILATTTAVAMLAAFIIAYRRTIGGWVRGSSPRPNTLRKAAGSLWLLVVLAYLVVAGIIHISQVAASQEVRAGPLLAPILAAAVGLSLYAVAVIVLARRFAATEAALRAAAAPPSGAVTSPDAADESAVEESTDAAAKQTAGAEQAAAAEQTALEAEPLLVWQARWHSLFRRLAGLAATAVAAGVLMVALDLLDVGSTLRETAGLVVVLFVAWGLYDATRTWIDGKIADETPSGGHGESEDGMGPGASRLATLLPLMRNILVVAMFTFMGAVGLAAMGVNVGPLFAGAGVLGLAIGFGAQTLIRDIFSGAFFLADDAFRKGEYIDVGGIMGAVEKISVRSFQLRHHNGPLHTIPFGEIKQLTNYSRDWVVMKLPLRVPYGTDVERLRKLIKKLGQQLLEDPEVGPLFMEPLKSQGVIEMEDSAMILRVKFMTKPGDQFVARRHVYTKIGEMFEREGIEFAHRYVTVRIDPANAPPEQQQAAAAAAEQILNAEEEGRRRA
ncbi:mechanosensitive ion channel domain-containing protein [Acuticoccus yangtzensis]|uniref:mechanosensitive ion channel domain-containing protein n=1 Tax=Acuticoccus yangtzensis TaxID=1443441 RepID=UPI000A594A7F|nr:mechanosensitive ion channel domain-containing protein [Acuticoccus yangtzensis]